MNKTGTKNTSHKQIKFADNPKDKIDLDHRRVQTNQ